jgi:hypothetical protein
VNRRIRIVTERALMMDFGIQEISYEGAKLAPQIQDPSLAFGN